MSVLEGLKPERVFYYFERLTQIPHGSRNTKAISDYIAAFAVGHGLPYRQDESNNVIISKPASPGYEGAVGVILQGHMDMVCEKRPDVEHDFERDALKLRVDGDSVTASGTTLGGDNGIAVAYMLAILEDGTLMHPALECVFTTDEEIGLLGAYALDMSVLKGRRMINLDSEEEGSIWVSCAGGMTAQCEIPVTRAQAQGCCAGLEISGLLGGHSGTEINKNRANATVLMGRFLYELSQRMEFCLIEAEGGRKDNAIPRATSASIVVEPHRLGELEQFAAAFQKALRNEYLHSDEGIAVSVEARGEGTYTVLSPVSREKVIFFLMNVPNGVQKMSGSIEGLVETSCNLGVFSMPEQDDVMFACSSVRSSVESARDALGEKLCYLTEFLGGEYHVEGAYPAWEYRESSPLRELMVKVYESMYQKKPEVVAIHAGLECGLFYDRIGGLDCVSIGPDMRDVHTSEEALSVSSTERVYRYLLEVLAAMKE